VNCEDVVETVRIAGSMPIVMAKEKRSSQATVASEFADLATGQFSEVGFETHA